MAGDINGTGPFITRTQGCWYLNVGAGSELRPVTIDELATIVPPRASDVPNSHDSIQATQLVVEAAWAWVGLVTGKGVRVQTFNGDDLLLDLDDLRVIDTLHPGRPAQVEALPGNPARIADLAASGRVLRIAAAAHAATADNTLERSDNMMEEGVATSNPPVVDLDAGGLDSPESASTPESWFSRMTRRFRPQRGQSPVAGVQEPAPIKERALIPVYSAWPKEVGPPLSLGMLTASARAWSDGQLLETYEIRRPEEAESCLAGLAAHGGPAVLLCSDYVWSLEHNLKVARRARELCPEILIIHGGPSSPKYEEDAERFLREHRGLVDVVVRGEGEQTLCELLEAIASEGQWTPSTERLASVAGLTFLDEETDESIRTEDRSRMAELDLLPSPYLTGEFDGLDPADWIYCLSIETNRGCPYGCTFCDWGSATMSRIRKFDIDRVIGEVEWAAALGVNTITLTDANFGIMSRDVEIARKIADVRRRTGYPQSLTWTAAKNTTKHLVKIMDELVKSNITVSTSLSLQSIDPSTLETIGRTNISTEHFQKLAADYRRRGFPLQGDLMLGLPGQSFESYVLDLQFMLDHEIAARSWPVQMLPNAPMNDSEYREDHRIVVDENNLVVSTATFSKEDRERMLRFRTVDAIAERMNVLRHVIRYLQWDRDITATTVMLHILDIAENTPDRFPLVSWLFNNFDLIPTVPVGWKAFYDEMRELLVDDFGLDQYDSALETVLALQEALMPIPGRTFPYTVSLPHDYLDYYRSATRRLYGDGSAGLPERPLNEWGPAEFTIRGDPLSLCWDGIHLQGDARNPALQGDFHIGASIANELDSYLMRILPVVSGNGLSNPRPDIPEDSETDADATVTSVALTAKH